MATARDAVINSDILVTVTTSTVSVFGGHDLRTGTHINAAGAYTPEMREPDDFTTRKSKIVVDTYEGCMAEAGDLLIPIRSRKISKERVHADLGEIVLGQKSARTRGDEITLFESVGSALEDLVVASLAYRRAKKRGTEPVSGSTKVYHKYDHSTLFCDFFPLDKFLSLCNG